MPHSPDDPSSGRIDAEAPSAPSAEGVPREPASPSEVNPAAVSGEPPRPFRRRRRRRRPPRPADPAQRAAAPPQSQTEEPETAEDAPESEDLPAMPTNAAGPRRRRRRRRGPRREPGSAEPAAHVAAKAAESAPQSSPNVAPPNDGEPRQDRPPEQPRSRRRRRRPPRPAGGSAAEADKIGTAPAAEGIPAGAPRDRSAPYRGSRNRGPRNRLSDDQRSPERGPVGDNRRSPDRGDRGRRASSRNDRRQGRDRDTPRKKPEQRLYALEAIVDRGFEDVVDAAEDNLTRRVHWTIVKRTVADQESGKPISAIYVLKRDGVDTEFPGLGAARSAANKTIVHPEKLTVSKAEHAAERAAAKK